MLTERRNSNERTRIENAPSLKNKASFVAIEAKPDPTEDGKITVSSSTVLNEGSLNHFPQQKSKEHKAYSGNESVHKQPPESKKEDLLKRSKSYANEEDYDTVIIEEEFFSPNKRKKLPRNIFPKKSMLMKSLSVNTTDCNSEQIIDYLPQTLGIYGFGNIVICLGGHTIRMGVSGARNRLSHSRQKDNRDIPGLLIGL